MPDKRIEAEQSSPIYVDQLNTEVKTEVEDDDFKDSQVVKQEK